MASEPPSETGAYPTVTEQGIMPVTIKLIREGNNQGSENGKWKVNGQVTNIVKIVGQVIQKADSMIIDFQVDDATGTIRVKYSNAPDDFDVSVGQYVCVAGSIALDKLNPFINAHQVLLVTNINQIQYHMLHACLVHLQMTNDNIPNTSAYSYNYNPAQSSQPEHADRVAEILQFIKEGGDLGKTKAEIEKQFSSSLSIKQIHENIEKLCERGDIYNSGDSYQPL